MFQRAAVWKGPPVKSPTTSYSTGHHALAGRVGGLRAHARHDSRALTAPARAAFLARFEAEVDPTSSLPLAERTRRALLARKAHFAGLALLSAQARAKSARRRARHLAEVRHDGQ
jgi:hypothetical protein